jgi:hypothetical protein
VHRAIGEQTVDATGVRRGQRGVGPGVGAHTQILAIAGIIGPAGLLIDRIGGVYSVSGK